MEATPKYPFLWDFPMDFPNHFGGTSIYGNPQIIGNHYLIIINHHHWFCRFLDLQFLTASFHSPPSPALDGGDIYGPGISGRFSQNWPASENRRRWGEGLVFHLLEANMEVSNSQGGTPIAGWFIMGKILLIYLIYIYITIYICISKYMSMYVCVFYGLLMAKQWLTNG